MAPQSSQSPVSALRAISYRISSTPAKKLPQIIPSLTSALIPCRSLLSSEDSSTSKEASEAAVVVHRFRTQISTLLQDRNIESRYAAIVLAKCSIEIGGREVLQKSGNWVRGLLSILGKPDPAATKKLCILTLTRLFLLTRDYPTLIRELTTPSLPPFITQCLKMLSPKASSGKSVHNAIHQSLLSTILHSLSTLLPLHPATFRTFASLLQTILLPLIAPTPSSTLNATNGIIPIAAVPLQIRDIAQRIFIQLHHCAPKGASSEEWSKALRTTIAATHAVADQFFRAVIEEWESVAGASPPDANAISPEREVGQYSPDALGLPAWSGIHAGAERLAGIVGLLKQFLTTPTSAPVAYPVGAMMDVLNRLLSITVPSRRSERAWESSVKVNTQIGGEEREALWLWLPDIHAAAMEVLAAMAERLDEAFIPMIHSSLELLEWTFRAEKGSLSVRAATYKSTAILLDVSGPTLPKQAVSALAGIMRACCDELLPLEESRSQRTAENAKQNGVSAKHATNNVDAFLKISKSDSLTGPTFQGVYDAAYTLLVQLFARLPAEHVSMPLRKQMDRAAILIQHQPAMLASVLNPPSRNKSGKSGASLLPFLARGFPAALEVEGILRPRMPVILTGSRAQFEGADDIGSEAEESDLADGTDGADGQDVALVDTTSGDGINLNHPLVDTTSGKGIHFNHQEPNLTNNQTHASHEPGNIREFIPNPSLQAPTQPDPNSSYQQLSRGAESDVQSLTPPEVPATPQIEQGGKRSFPEPQQDPPSPKRARLHTSDELAAPANDHALAAGVAPPSDAPIPVPVVIKDPSEPEDAHLATLPATALDLKMGDESDSDTDYFEIPPLTLDPDTEDEEDE